LLADVLETGLFQAAPPSSFGWLRRLQQALLSSSSPTGTNGGVGVVLAEVRTEMEVLAEVQTAQPSWTQSRFGLRFTASGLTGAER
jgi:hypothetical protein